MIAVADLIDVGHRVIFDDEGRYAVCNKCGEKMKFRKVRGVFVIDFDVEPYKRSSFSGPVQP